MSYSVSSRKNVRRSKLENRLLASVVTPWSRNPSWSTLTAPTVSEHKVVGLFAVWNTAANFVALSFSCTTAVQYSVNWGDGVSENVNSGTTVYHNFDYNDVDLDNTNAPVTFTDAGDLVNRTAHGYSNGNIVRFYNIVSTTGITAETPYYVVSATADTFQVSLTAGGSAIALTTNGSATLLPYKIALVEITTSTSFTTIDLSVKHNQSNLPSVLSTGWLDVAVASDACTVLKFGSSSQNLAHAHLERVRVVKLGALSSFSYLFWSCYSLRHVELDFGTGTITNVSNMFTECRGLQQIPEIITPSVTTADSMFYNCYSLIVIPKIDFSGGACTSLANMFLNCESLKESPPIHITASCVSVSQMFSGCKSLATVSWLNTVGVTNFASMFYFCSALAEIPPLNFSAATSLSSTFYGCTSLQELGNFSCTAATNISSMFSNCQTLKKVGTINVPSVTSLTNLFSNCYCLQSIGTITAGTVTNTSYAFSSNYMLVSAPTITTTSSLTNCSYMFQNCYSLQNVTLFDTSGALDMSGMFSTCRSLETIPHFNTAAATNTSYMFQNCSALRRIPLLNTALSTNFTNMFTSCLALERIPALNASAVTSFANLVNSCYSLTEVPALDMNGATSSGAYSQMYSGSGNIAAVKTTNCKFTHSISAMKLSAAALDEVYTNLPTVTAQTITVSGNYGTTGDDPTIATAKGWTVTG